MKRIKEELFRWSCKKHAMNSFLDRQMLREKALELTRMRGLNGFKCSDAWLTNFLKEHGFSTDLINRTGPMFNDYRDWIDLMRSTIIKYKHNDLFHADELIMYSDVLPSKISSNEMENPEGTKSTTNRLTILTSCNSSGTTKLPLLICGPYPSRITAKEHVYCYSETSYIGGELFKNWLSSVNDRMVRCKRKILLFLRHNRAHALKDFVASNVQLVYFPENFPPLLRPLRRDVFHYIKMVFRRRYAERLKQYIDEWNLRDILSSLIEAWETIPRELIVFSFQRTHFRTDDCFLQMECDSWDSLKAGVSFKRFVTFDDDLSDEPVSYEKNDQYTGYMLRTNCNNVVQINEDSLDSVLEDTGNVEERTTRGLSNESNRNYSLKSLKLRNRINRKLDSVAVTHSRDETCKDKHWKAKRTRLNENPFEGNNQQRNSRKRTYNETQFSTTKERSGNRRASCDRNIKNTFVPKDSKAVSSRSIGEKAAKEPLQRLQPEVNKMDEALTFLSLMNANHAKNLIDSIDAINQDIMGNVNNLTRSKHLNEQNDARLECTNRKTVRSECANKIGASTSGNFFGNFNQPSTSRNNWNALSEGIDQSVSKETVKHHDSNVLINLNDRSNSSSVHQKALTFSKKKRRKSTNLSGSGDDSQSREPSKKKSKTDHNWSKQFETTFVFGSPNTNCSSGTRHDENIVDSCIFNVRSSISPRD